MPTPKGAGDLRDRVKFQRRASGDDGYGNTESGFTDLGIERSCSLTPTRGGEAVQSGRLTGSASWDLWVRADSGTKSLTVGDQVVDTRDASRTFNIVFGPADMDGRNAWLLLQCTSGTAGG
jgi:head-tail adaptor